VAARSATRDQPDSFDLSRPQYPPGGQNEDVSGQGDIQHSRIEMQKLAGNCQLASEEVSEARVLLETMNGGRSEWERDEGIGISTTGPFGDFNNLAVDLVALTRNTADELAEAGQKITKASLDFDATDADIQQTLNQQTGQIRREETSRNEDLVFG
jgi:hypothetical protein